jgi:hypothetical protein
MTISPKSKCWNCGSLDMKAKGSYFECQDCGATYNDLPDMRSSEITVVDEETGGAPRANRPTRAKVSGTAARRAARARESRG